MTKQSKSDRNGGGKKSGKAKRSINQILGIGRPGPHLLQHQKRKNCKETAVDGAQLLKKDSKEPRKQRQRRPVTGGSKEAIRGKACSEGTIDDGRQSTGAGRSHRAPAHYHHIPDPHAHSGTYLDEYDQDLQYEYAPDLWQPLTSTSTSTSTSSAAHQSAGPPFLTNRNAPATGPGMRRKGPHNAIAPLETEGAGAYVSADAIIPTIDELRWMHLERIRQRNGAKRAKKAPQPDVLLRRQRKAFMMKGQGNEQLVKQMIEQATSAYKHVPLSVENFRDQLDMEGPEGKSGSTRDAFELGADFVGFGEPVITATPIPTPTQVQAARTTLASTTAGRLTQKRKRTGDNGNDSESNAGPPPGCPWMGTRRYSALPSVPRMLAEELKDFVRFLSPTPEEHQIRTYVYQRVRMAVQSLWSDAVVEVFGSFETQLYLPTSDLDIVILREDLFKSEELRRLKNHLESTKIGTDFEIVPKARVPLVKFKESISGIPVDISFNVTNGIRGAKTTKFYMDQTPGLRPLVMLVKHFLKQNRVNEPYHGGVGSFLTLILVLSFLQIHPQVQSKLIDPEENLGVLLMEFFELYGTRFNYDEVGIRVAGGEAYGGGYFSRNDVEQANNRQRSALDASNIRLTALDPNDALNNVGTGAKNISRVRSLFASAFEKIMRNVGARNLEFRSGTRAKPEVSLIRDLFSVPDKVLESRRHLQTIYHQQIFPALLIGKH